MEELDLVEEWLANEKELRPLLEKMFPLLEKRRALEEKLPTLALLRDKKEVLPREAPPSSSTSSSFLVPPERGTMLMDNRTTIPGNPPRYLPSEKQLLKIAEKKRKANRKKHLKEKEKVKEAKKQRRNKEQEEMEEEPKEGNNE